MIDRSCLRQVELRRKVSKHKKLKKEKAARYRIWQEHMKLDSNLHIYRETSALECGRKAKPSRPNRISLCEPRGRVDFNTDLFLWPIALTQVGET